MIVFAVLGIFFGAWLVVSAAGNWTWYRRVADAVSGDNFWREDGGRWTCAAVGLIFLGCGAIGLIRMM